ncbi:hypothetical protein DFAR_1020007 [Desulfarculales bacterium]
MPSFTSPRARPTYLQALRQVLLKRGYHASSTSTTQPSASITVDEITVSLDIALVHSPSYMLQGRGKIERFFRTVRS